MKERKGTSSEILHLKADILDNKQMRRKIEKEKKNVIQYWFFFWIGYSNVPASFCSHLESKSCVSDERKNAKLKNLETSLTHTNFSLTLICVWYYHVQLLFPHTLQARMKKGALSSMWNYFWGNFFTLSTDDKTPRGWHFSLYWTFRHQIPYTDYDKKWYYSLPDCNICIMFSLKFFMDTSISPNLKKIRRGANLARNLEVENGSSVFKH